MATIQRRAITLLEMIIVIAILSLASGIVAISISKALVDQRFRSEVGMVVDELRLAQDLMLILDTDVHVYFKLNSNRNGIDYGIELETQLSPHVQREVTRKKKSLTTVKGIFFRDDLERRENYIDIKFLSNGAVMSSGILRLATTDDESVPKGTLESFVCLAGYPKPIMSSETKEEAEKNCYKFEEGFDDRLTQDTIQRLPEKLKQPNLEEEKKEEEKDRDNNREKSKDNKNQPAKKDDSAVKS